eukprot:gene25509-biopygen10656
MYSHNQSVAIGGLNKLGTAQDGGYSHWYYGSGNIHDYFYGHLRDIQISPCTIWDENRHVKDMYERDRSRNGLNLRFYEDPGERLYWDEAGYPVADCVGDCRIIAGNRMCRWSSKSAVTFWASSWDS